ncbi:Ras protein [Mycena venus]|uniref:Ras protein n=1 Tax=Mycena venus TaxID=2733690 RepID=A0A8H7CQZ4_9AGAR|nr:Ras protein [Mycena venus]
MDVTSDSVSQTYMKPFESIIVLLGASGAGKTALAMRFFESRWDNTDYAHSLDICWRSFRVLNNYTCFIEALIVHEHESDVLTARNNYLRERGAFLLVYSVTSRVTFERLEEFRQSALHGSHPTTPLMIVVGTKFDCTEAEREVSEAEGAEFAANIGCPFVETSAKTSHNVESAFVELVRELLERSPPVVPTPPRKRGRSRKRCVIM